MIKRRSVLAGMAVSSAALGLAACGGSETATTTAPADNSANKSSDGGTGEVVELTYQHRLPDVEGMVLVKDIVARWNEENPDIQVTATKFDGPAQEMIIDIENKANAGNAPDLAQVGYGEIPNLFVKGLLEDVTDIASQYTSNFAAGAVALMTAGEAIVGLPQDTGPLVYYYNEAEFERLGIAVPTTGEELLAAARTAQADGKYALSFQSDEAQYGLSAMAAGAGAVWFSAEGDAWKVSVESDETSLLSEFWQTALDENIALLEPRWGEGFGKALLEGTLIGTIGAAWEGALIAGDLKEAPSAGSWKVAQLPAFGSSPLTGPDGGSGVAVIKGSKNPEAAMKFNDWFNRQIADLATQGLVVAANGSVETPEALSTFFGGQDVMGEYAKANEAMNPNFIYIPTWPTLGEPMKQAAEAAGAGSADVAAIFTAAQTSAVSTLKDAGLPVAE